MRGVCIGAFVTCTLVMRRGEPTREELFGLRSRVLAEEEAVRAVVWWSERAALSLDFGARRAPPVGSLPRGVAEGPACSEALGPSARVSEPHLAATPAAEGAEGGNQRIEF